MKRLVKERVGKVIQNKMSKTVVVAVERRAMDPKAKKYIKKVTHFKVHDEKSQCKPGDQVEIFECKPISKEKRWSVRKILSQGAAA
ncbi:MAG: 30S ribosomal protein S17 [Deltaproteobacteria bacterium]|nr:30S ribosomal protein S17 [Deltaproteobacteria bacterium]